MPPWSVPPCAACLILMPPWSVPNNPFWGRKPSLADAAATFPSTHARMSLVTHQHVYPSTIVFFWLPCSRERSASASCRMTPRPISRSKSARQSCRATTSPRRSQSTRRAMQVAGQSARLRHLACAGLHSLPPCLQDLRPSSDLFRWHSSSFMYLISVLSMQHLPLAFHHLHLHVLHELRQLAVTDNIQLTTLQLIVDCLDVFPLIS